MAKLIDDIYVQERTDKTDEQCKLQKKPGISLLMHRKSWMKARTLTRIILEEIQEMHRKMIR